MNVTPLVPLVEFTHMCGLVQTGREGKMGENGGGLRTVL